MIVIPFACSLEDVHCQNVFYSLKITPTRAHEPDLILVDIQMPGLNGLETVRVLREVDACRCVPIVALTAYAEKYERQTYIDAGFTDYQQKQAGIKPLITLVQKHLG